MAVKLANERLVGDVPKSDDGIDAARRERLIVIGEGDRISAFCAVIESRHSLPRTGGPNAYAAVLTGRCEHGAVLGIFHVIAGAADGQG